MGNNDVIERAKKLESIKAALEVSAKYVESKAQEIADKYAAGGTLMTNYDSRSFDKAADVGCAIQNALSELLTLVPEDKDEWQDISSYDKEAQETVLLCEEAVHTVASWTTEEEYWTDGNVYIDSMRREEDSARFCQLFIDPTRWMPLPTLPKQEQSKPNKE